MSRPRVRILLVGLAMGAADAVPGVSGGTVALVTGIYDRLVTALSAIDHRLLLRFFAAIRRRSPTRFADVVRDGDLRFLVLLGAGIAGSIITVTRVIAAGIASAPIPTFGLFSGLIAGSGWVLRRELRLRPPLVGVVTIGACIAAVGTSVLGTRPLADGTSVVFLSGMLAVSATILPGISGSLILLVLGQYTLLAGSLATVVDAALLRPVVGVRDAGVTVLVFLAGAAIGLGIMVRLIAWAIDRYRSATASVLIALVVGATAAPVYRASVAVDHTWDNQTLGVFVGVALIGFVLILVIDRVVGLHALSDR